MPDQNRRPRAPHAARLPALALLLALCAAAPPATAAGPAPAAPAATAASTAARHMAARQALWKRDFAWAAALWRSMAEAGDAAAMVELAHMARRGDGQPADAAAARRLYEAAAAKGNPDGEAGLGRIAETGAAGARDPAEAVRRYRAAAARGGLWARYYFALHLRSGEHVPQDLPQSLRLLRESAAKGLVDAEHEVALAQREGWGTPIDLPAFVATMERLAKLGHPDSQREWGLALARGQGVKQQPAQALEWLQRAAERADSGARNVLAMAHHQGELGLKADPVQAAAFARLAAEDDEVQSQWMLALMHANGEGGLARDGAQIVKWLRRASENGDKRAGLALARVLTEGAWGQQVDCSAARPHALQAAAGGEHEAEALLDDIDQGACTHGERWAEVRRGFARVWNWPEPLVQGRAAPLKPEEEKALYVRLRAVLKDLVGQGVNAARCALARVDIADSVEAGTSANATLPLLRQGAQAGALQCMELMYWFGRQSALDDGLGADEANAWARRAAARGYTHAMEQLETFYAEGYGVEQDYQHALMWNSLRAWRKGDDAEAMPSIEGRLTPRQREAALARAQAFHDQHPGWGRSAPSWPPANAAAVAAAALLDAPFPLLAPNLAPAALPPPARLDAARRDAPQLRLASDGHTAAITAMATDAQGRWIVTASADKTLAVWRLPEGRREAVLRVPVGNDSEGRLRAVALSADGRWVAAAGDTGAAWPGGGHAVYVLERDSGRLVQRLDGLPEPVTQLQWLDDGRLLAAATDGASGELHLFRREDGRRVAREVACDGAVRALESLPDGQLLAACADAQLQNWRVVPAAAAPLQRGARVRVPGGAMLSTARLAPDGRSVAVSFCSSSRVSLVDAATLQFRQAVKPGVEFGDMREARCEHLGWLGAGQALVRGGSLRDKLVWRLDVWDRLDQPEPRGLPLADQPITALLTVPGRGLAYATRGGAWGLLASLATPAKPALLRARGVLELRTNRYYGPQRPPGQVHVNGRVDSDGPDWENASDKRPDGSTSLSFRDRDTDLANGLGLSRDGEIVAFSARTPDGRRLRLAFDAVNQRFATERLKETEVPRFDADWVHTWRDAWGLPPVLVLRGERVALPDGESPRALAVAADGGSVLVGTAHRLLRYGRDGQLMWQVPVPDAVEGVSAARDGRWIVAALGDGTVRWYAAVGGRELAALFVHPDFKRWVLWTPEGPYVASPGAESLFGWHLNQGPAREPRFVGSERLYDVFYRPDIVGAKLRGEPVDGLATTTVAQALARPAPRVSLDTPKAGPGDEQARLCWRVTSEGGGIGDVRLFHNGKLIRSRGQYRESVPGVRTLAAQGGESLHRQLRSLGTAAPAAMAPLAPQADTAAPVDDCADVPLLPGENTLAVAAFNADNSVQSPLVQQVVVSKRSAPKPRLFVLAIGIDEFAEPSARLEYAAKDARDIHALLQKTGLSTGRFESVQAKLLTNRQADKPGIERALGELAQQVRPWDSVVFFVASHGVMDGQRYHLVTAGFDGELKPATLIDSRELIEWSKRIPALHQLMILDTCHAGGVDWIVKGLYDARLSVLARQMGLHIFASASDRQLALDGFEGNGLFTHTLLGVAARGEVSGVNEWGLAARSDTTRIAARLKHAQTPLIISFGRDFPLLKP